MLSDQHLADVATRIESGVCHVCRNGLGRISCRACDGTGAFHLATSVVQDVITELRARRAADLNAEDVEALRKFVDKCDADYATGDGPVPSSALLSVLDKLLAAAGGGG